MKKIFKFFAAALAIVAAASCVDTTSSDSREEQYVEMVDVTFTASLESPVDPTTSKTSLASDGVSVHWSSNDAISVFPYCAGTTSDDNSPYKGNEVKVVNESIKEGFADFIGEVYPSSSYAAIFPNSCINKGSAYHDCWTLRSNTIKNQTAVVGGFPKADFGVAHIAMALECENASSFKFKNQLSYLKFKLNTLTPVTEIVISSDKTSYANGRGHDIYLSESAGLGGAMYYNPHKGRWYMNGNGDISFKNDGNPFVNGEVYYIALPAVEIEGLHLTAKSASGATIIEFKKASVLDEAANLIYNLGVLNQTVEDVNLNISNKNITAPNIGGTVDFTLQCNNDWTIEENYDWLTLSRTSGSKSDDASIITLAVTPNASYYQRKAYVKVKSGAVSQEIVVTQNVVNNYNIGNIVTKAADLENNGIYIIQNASNKSMYWHTHTSNGSLEYTSIMSGTSSFGVQYVFCYHEDNSKGTSSDNRYNSVSTGAWKSVYNGYYMSSVFVFNQNVNNAVYIAHSNRWDNPSDDFAPDTGNDIDMCEIGSTKSICWNGIKYLWGDTGQNNRKWYIYKAVPVN